VWKREQEAEREKRKVEDLRKQYEEERQRQELEEVAEAAGHKVWVPHPCGSALGAALRVLQDIPSA
jgi:hypothetical protein